jgi:O-antigen/teichoic acid export membrane protein
MTDESRRNKVARHVLLNSASNYVGKIINLGVWFILTPFILAQLGASLYGLMALVGSVVAYGLLIDVGVNGAVTKYVAEYRARDQAEMAHTIIATALWANTGLGLLAILIGLLFAPLFARVFNVPTWQHQTATWLFALSGIGIAVTIPAQTVTAVLRGLQRFDLINLIGIIASLVTAVATVLVLRLGGGVIGLAVVGIVVILLVQLLSTWFVRRIAPELKFGWFHPSRPSLKTLVSYSWSLFLMNLGGYFESRSGELAIGGFLPISAVTPYNLARRLSAVPQSLTQQFLMLLLPMASETHAQEETEELRSLYIVGTRVTLAILLPITAGLVILAKPFLAAWVGVEYAAYSYLIIILAVASLIDTSTWPAGLILQGIARHSPLAAMTIASGIANFILSFLLVNRLGLLGVALGSLIPTTVVCLGLVTPYAMRVMGTSAREMSARVLWPTLCPVIPMTIILFALREVLHPTSVILILIVGAAGAAVYLGVYLLMGANEFERAALRHVVGIFRSLASSWAAEAERN